VEAVPGGRWRLADEGINSDRAELAVASACPSGSPVLGQQLPDADVSAGNSVPDGDTLILRDSDPSTLDPAMARETGSVGYIMQIFSGLVTFDESMNLVPDIAENWETDNTGTIYTFHLREGVTFHDGRPVTAADFKYSWERACDPATGSETAGTYLNDIIGAVEMLAGNAQEMAGVLALDDHTLRVAIDQPRAYFLSKLAQPVAFVVNRDNVDAGGNGGVSPMGPDLSG